MICNNIYCILREYEKGIYCSDEIKKKCRDYKTNLQIQLKLFEI